MVLLISMHETQLMSRFKPKKVTEWILIYATLMQMSRQFYTLSLFPSSLSLSLMSVRCFPRPNERTNSIDPNAYITGQIVARTNECKSKVNINIHNLHNTSAGHRTMNSLSETHVNALSLAHQGRCPWLYFADRFTYIYIQLNTSGFCAFSKRRCQDYFRNFQEIQWLIWIKLYFKMIHLRTM